MDLSNPQERDTVVRKIIDLMIDSEWDTRAALRLGESYELNRTEVRELASEAMRHIRLYAGSDEDVRTQIILSIQYAERRALEAQRSVYDPQTGMWASTPQPDLRALEKFLRLRGELLGLISSGKQGGPRAPSIDVAVADLRGLLADIDRQKAKHDSSSETEA